MSLKSNKILNALFEPNKKATILLLQNQRRQIPMLKPSYNIAWYLIGHSTIFEFKLIANTKICIVCIKTIRIKKNVCPPSHIG